MGESYSCQQAMGREGKSNPEYIKFMREHVQNIGPIDTHMSESCRKGNQSEIDFWDVMWNIKEAERKREEENFWR